MQSILKRAWVDIVFLLAVGLVILAGGRGFRQYFIVLMALAFLYFVLKVVLFFKKTGAG